LNYTILDSNDQFEVSNAIIIEENTSYISDLRVRTVDSDCFILWNLSKSVHLQKLNSEGDLLYGKDGRVIKDSTTYFNIDNQCLDISGNAYFAYNHFSGTGYETRIYPINQQGEPYLETDFDLMISDLSGNPRVYFSNHNNGILAYCFDRVYGTTDSDLYVQFYLDGVKQWGDEANHICSFDTESSPVCFLDNAFLIRTNNAYRLFKLDSTGGLDNTWPADGVEIPNDNELSYVSRLLKSEEGFLLVCSVRDSNYDEKIMLTHVSDSGEHLLDLQGVSLNSEESESLCSAICANEELYVVSHASIDSVYSILVQKYDTSGNPIWDEPAIISNSSYERVINFDDNALVIGYRNNTSGFYSLQCSVIDKASGENYNSIEPIEFYHGSFASNLLLNKFGNNSLVATWIDTRSSFGDLIKGQKGIYAQKMTFSFTDSEDQNEPYEVSHLSQNFPNPFLKSGRSETTIRFTLAKDSPVELTIYNIKGQKVKTLIDDELKTGCHQIIWDGLSDSGKAVANGVYMYRLKDNSSIISRKMIILK
jgi:hypothetical protein